MPYSLIATISQQGLVQPLTQAISHTVSSDSPSSSSHCPVLFRYSAASSP
jgi:hypothetical protein